MSIVTTLRPSAPTLEQHNQYMPGIVWSEVHDGVRIGLVDGFPARDVCRQVNVDRHLSLAMMIKGNGHFVMEGVPELCTYDSGYCYLSCACEPFTGMDFFPAYHDLKLAIVHFSLEWLEVFAPLMASGKGSGHWFSHPQRQAGVLRLRMTAEEQRIAGCFMADGVPDNPLLGLKAHARTMELLWGLARRLTAEGIELEPAPLSLDTPAPPRINRRERRLLLAARTYIQEHCLEPLTVPEISRMVGIGHGVLKRQFNELFGTSVYSYVLDCRLEQAGKLLRSSDLPIKEVAWRCGFSHSSHLSRLFRQRHEMSPKEYRQA
ncbi:helix-turn-helix transcriptional regulator [Pseudomonas agarici]|uniref:helix-turn-helix transcriptional regulator n=1 Tax=Pseudomonas agarici TaxID=46677 RepID=UPI0002E680C4|nr:AraC family transcriptional regulator [Pseudomonas agarici]NWB89999.1 helix-turn-helix transcriptional regulator [Pseudomonas agarici]NWC08220.1 helix-turn-helix transcriptional regulator [Pseudomonas agarici]SEK83586.1 AraC family transcriptional regulator [Pseudomonas agarici]